MARVKRAVHSKKQRRVVLTGPRATTATRAGQLPRRQRAGQHSLQYAYHDRRARKGDFRKLWIQRINAACRLNGTTYSRFIAGLRRRRDRGRSQGPRRSRRHDPDAFAALVAQATAAAKENA